jgi:hypothetical protein
MTQGDHVRARKGGVWDHAIDLGDRTVLRFARPAGIQRCGYVDFVAGADRVEVVVHRERAFRPSLVVARAFSRLSESAYGAMFASSEQFAVWCKIGRVPPGGGAPPAEPRARRPAARKRPAGKKAPPGKAAKVAPRPRRKKRVASASRSARRPGKKAAPRRASRKARHR